jgi:hypothetical protein
MEREALAAKESLFKFQPFIEGEQILLVTDHAALTWAKTYKNANRRLALWGLVFAVYPCLKIVYCPGHMHSNVNPLSRLPQLPAYATPARDDLPDKSLDNEHGTMECAWSQFLRSQETQLSVMAVTRLSHIQLSSQVKRMKESVLVSVPNRQRQDQCQGIHVAPGTLLIQIVDEMVQEFLDGYPKDAHFGPVYARSEKERPHDLKQQAYQLSDNGLLYFEDADRKLCLCIPASMQAIMMREVHDSPHEGAHAGWEKTLAKLRDRFYWPSMRQDVIRYVQTCDPCQKTKHD